MKARFCIAIPLLAAVMALTSCGGSAIPNLPTLSATTDQELRDVEMYALRVLHAEVDLLNQASKTEDLIAKSTPNFPPAVDKALRAGISDAATKSDALAQDIVAGRIKTSAVIKARVEPIVKQLADLQALAKPQGHPTLMAALDIVANIAVQLLMSGTGVGAMR